MSRSSGDPSRAGDRAAVEPIAALVAVVAVGAALGLYIVAVSDVAPDRERDLAANALDGVERDATVGGVVDPERLDAAALEATTDVTIELATAGETWRTTTGAEMVDVDARSQLDLDVAKRSVTVRVAPGVNVRGTLRVAVHG